MRLGGEMTSKVLVSGKHSLTVRVTEEDYKKLRIVGAIENCTVQEILVREAMNYVNSIIENK